MSWTLGAPLQPGHRARLEGFGIPGEILDRMQLGAVEGPLPEWWASRGNALYVEHGCAIPNHLVEALLIGEVSDALVVFGSDLTRTARLLLGGDGATVFVGPSSYLGGAEMYCGAGSAIILMDHCTTVDRPWIDARNGGSIVAEPDQLWAKGAVVSTDDMHRLEDLATGERINPYGCHIRLGSHIWVGRDAIITGNTTIGPDSVVGMRSLVRGKTFPANVAVAGTPARVIRKGVTWSREDLPDVRHEHA